MENQNPEKIAQALEKILNRHGYGFQYSILKRMSDLFDQNKSSWLFEAVEFPVEVQGEGTRIDLVHRRNSHPPFYLLAECKRANPALSNWCFARAPFIRRNRDDERCFLERIQPDGARTIRALAPKRYIPIQNAYHIALEVKTNETGDACGQGRGAIEEAATQIMRGLNGMIEFAARNLQILEPEKTADFLPAIFTTATIWTTEVDLSSADITSGNIAISNATFKQQAWIAYQYHLSPGLKHTWTPTERPDSLGEILDTEFIRTIAIVSVPGIDEFLRWASLLEV